MKKIVEQIRSLLRRIKLIHIFFNLLNYTKLKKNKSLYQSYGLKKTVYSSLCNNDFKNSQIKSSPWLDSILDKDSLNQNEGFQNFSDEEKMHVLKWIDSGYMCFSNYFNTELIDAINNDVDIIIRDKKLPFHYSNPRIMNGFKHSEAIKRVLKDDGLLKLFDFVMGKKVKPFQTMNFLYGSEAKVHSDSIHMTTEPLGYLLAIWVALEDVTEESGPLFYFEGSHKLPYIMSQDFKTGNTPFLIGDDYYENYTEFMEEKVNRLGLTKKIFLPKKGDVFVWHANLLHGGMPVHTKKSTRKSLVVHYFCEGVLCYHEITQRPAVFEEV